MREQEPTWVIAIAGSAGAIEPLRTILGGLPAGFQGAVAIVQHRPPHMESQLPQILQRVTPLRVVQAEHGDRFRRGTVYIARPDFHLTVTADGLLRYVDGGRIHQFRSSANPLMESLADAMDGRVIAVVLSGGGADATDGVQAVKGGGGVVIAQEPWRAEQSSMPSAAIASGAVDYVLPTEAIAPAITAIMNGEPVAGPV
jgi:two-component system chemotaxis response regulator CheB